MSGYAAHTSLIQTILLALGARPDCRVWRQEVGLYYTRRTFVPVNIGVPGMADIGGIYHGRVLQIEVKTGKGRLGPRQRAWRDMIVAFGGLYIEARSLEDAVKALPNL